MQDEFYIGYLPKAPSTYAKHVRITIITFIIIILILAISIAWYQRGFSTATFEFGSASELTGKIFKEPVPVIKVLDGKDNYGNNVYKTILLVGYGKHGARGILDEFEKNNDISLQNEIVNLNGTLIYGDGKTLMELTKGLSSLKNVVGDSTNVTISKESLGPTMLKGEIIDPKCYFGVMKPGEGKPHRSCAIRCISGGIPPVLAVKNEKGDRNYFLILGEGENSINQFVLDYVGEPVEIEGELERLDDWLAVKIKTQPLGIKRLASSDQ